MKQIYYDALFTGLIPVNSCMRKESYRHMVTAIVSKTTGPYKKGDVVESFARNFVHKVPGGAIFLKVRPALIV